MESESDRGPESAIGAGPTASGSVPAEVRDGPRAPQAERPAHPDLRVAGPASGDLSAASPAGPAAHRGRRWLLIHGIILSLVVAGYFLYPVVMTMLNTVSTDDAYVNGHVTFVAPRVAGQVSRILVDDNYRVKKGDLLVQLDREPNQVQVDIKKAAVANAEADQQAAEAQVRAILGLARSQRWKLQTAIEQVDNQIALLRARVAALKSKEATLERASADLNRAQALFSRGAIAREEFDQRREAEHVANALAHQALEEVYETRVILGLPPRPEKGELSDVPVDLNQSFSGVRQALAELVQSIAQVGLPLTSTTRTPKQAIDEFISRDKEGNIDRIMERIVPGAPAVRQAVAKRKEAERDLAQAELNLRYCDIVSEIDGVVTRRNVNPGNNVSGGAEPDGRPLAHARSGSTPTSRRRSLRTCASASECAARWTCTAAAESTRAASPASPWGPVRPWPCCRRRTPPATS